MKYKLVGDHAEDTAEGEMIGPGGFTGDRFDPWHPHNKRLIDEGKLIQVDQDSEPAATDAARALAEENQVPLTAVSGSGADGRITKEDVERHIADTSDGEEGQ